MTEDVLEEWEGGWRAGVRRRWWGSVRPLWLRLEWPVVWGLALAALVLGAWGFHLYYLKVEPEPKSALDELYLSVQLYILQSGALKAGLPWQLELARWLAPAVTAYTATKALLVIFRDQLTSIRLRLFYRNHHVVCGLGRKGYLLARSLRAGGGRVVVVESDEQNPRIERCRELGVLVVTGSAADPSVLRRARVQDARWVVSLLPDDGENAEVAGQARALSERRRGEGLTCLAHITEPQLCDQLIDRELATAPTGAFRLEFFNVYQRGARELLAADRPFDRPTRPHLLVVGLGRMGMSLIAQAAGEWHAHPRGFREYGPLHVTFVDREARDKVGALRFSHPQVGEVCWLAPLQMDVYSTEFGRAEFLRGRFGSPPVTSAYVCLDQDGPGLYAGLTLAGRRAEQNVRVVVRMTHDAGLARLLRDEPSLRPFKLFDRVCHRELLAGTMFEAIARAIHADYVRDRAAEGQTPRSNPSMAPWEELATSLRASNLGQAQHIGEKLRAVGCGIERAADGDGNFRGFSPEEVETMARMEHERWMEEKTSQGVAYGPTRTATTHPAMLAWGRLPEEERAKNRGTVERIPEQLRAVGYRVFREKRGG